MYTTGGMLIFAAMLIAVSSKTYEEWQFYPCFDNPNVILIYKNDNRMCFNIDNQYVIRINNITDKADIALNFDRPDDTEVELLYPNGTVTSDGSRFKVNLDQISEFVRINVIDKKNGGEHDRPYITNITINDVESCKRPKQKYFEYYNFQGQIIQVKNCTSSPNP